MSHQSYAEQKRFVFKGLLLLAVITVLEVGFALIAKGRVSPSITFGKDPGLGKYLYMLVMIGASIYKAYFIVFFFMHMAHEVKGLMFSVLLPTLLLVWAIIAFFSEGSFWLRSREGIKERNELPVGPSTPAAKPTGYILPTNALPIG